MGPIPQGESCEVKKLSAHLEWPSQARTAMRRFRISGRSATCAWKTNWREFSTEVSTDHHLPAREAVCIPTKVSRGWVLRFRLQGLEPRKRTGVDCSEDILRGYIQHSWGSLGKSLGLPERQETFVRGTVYSMHLQTVQSYFCECHRWDEQWLQQVPEAGAVTKLWFKTP